ncbi:MAG: hypothetical protein WC942_06020 [Clostridia bacterium]|jgi:hypothetical protein
MNWYKRNKLASNNIKFPENIEEDINEISEYCVNYYFEGRQGKEFIKEINFINPYKNKQERVYIVVYPSTSNKIEAIASFNSQNKTIVIFPYHNNTDNINRYELFILIKRAVYHEITHAIDPKLSIPNWQKNRINIKYELKQEEFDAYSKQIEITIKNNLNENNFEEFKNWLLSSDINTIPFYLDWYKNKFLKEWEKYKPIYIKKLKQRLYNIFIKR